MLDGADAADGGRSDPRRLSHGCGRGVADRSRGAHRSGRGAGRADRRRFAATAAPSSSAWPNAEERDLLWKGRKNAFGAIGRVSPPTMCRTAWCRAPKLRRRCSDIAEMGEQVRVHDQQHLSCRRRQPAPHHPLQSAKRRRPGAGASGREEILDHCIQVGGSITGEHGVGMEKMELMAHMFSSDSLDMIGYLKHVFDPECLLNPGKLLPTGRGCLEIRQPPSMEL